jgi:hypothetical protein
MRSAVPIDFIGCDSSEVCAGLKAPRESALETRRFSGRFHRRGSTSSARAGVVGPWQLLWGLLLIFYFWPMADLFGIGARSSAPPKRRNQRRNQRKRMNATNRIAKLGFVVAMAVALSGFLGYASAAVNHVLQRTYISTGALFTFFPASFASAVDKPQTITCPGTWGTCTIQADHWIEVVGNHQWQ